MTEMSFRTRTVPCAKFGFLASGYCSPGFKAQPTHPGSLRTLRQVLLLRFHPGGELNELEAIPWIVPWCLQECTTHPLQQAHHSARHGAQASDMDCLFPQPPSCSGYSDNLLPLQEDLISGLKGSQIILYPISVCLCELTMASF